MANPYGMTEFDVGGALNAYAAGQQMRMQRMQFKQQQDAAAEAKTKQTGVRAAIGAYAKAPDAPNAQKTLFDSLLVIDPETAFNTHKAFSEMSAEDAKAAHDRLSLASGAFASLLQVPAPQREQYRAALMPKLVAAGIPEAEIMAVPLDDEHLTFGANQGRDVDKILKDAQPDLRNVGAGDVLIDERNPGAGPVYESPYVKGADGTLYQRPTASQPAPPTPAIGEQRGGYRFKGGDPANPAAWEKTGGAGSGGPQTFP